MLPVLFKVGPFTLHTYGLLVAAGFAAALFYCSRQAARDGFAAELVSNLFFVVVVSAIVGSRALYVAFNIRYFADHPLRAFAVWEGGLVFHGGLLLAALTAYVYLKRSGVGVWRMADITAPAVALGQGIGRLGCLAAGCCFGSPTDLPWGITFTHPETLAPSEIPLHPTQLYSSLSLLTIFLLLHFYRLRRPLPGKVFFAYLFLASAGRLVEDSFRGEGAKLAILPSFSATQLIALLIMAVSAFLFLRPFGEKASPPGS